MRLYRLNKAVVSFRNNPAPFLNGITSNTIEAPRNAFLNIHGKIIATFDQLKISEQEIWIVLEDAFATTVLEHITKYARLAKVDVARLKRFVYFDLDGNTALLPGDCIVAQKKGRLIISEEPKTADVSEDEFLRFRLKHAIALHGLDYQDDFILNVSTDEFTSFTKGCYLGQEPVSKVHHRSRPTWRLVVKKAVDCTEEERSRLTSLIDGERPDKAMGFVFEKNA